MEHSGGRVLRINRLPLSRLSVFVVVIIASTVNLLQLVVSLAVIRSSRIDSFGAGMAIYEVKQTTEWPNSYVSHHFQTLISTLEAVGVLDDANESNCFVLENLTKEWRPGVDGISMVQVSLQLKQFRVPEGMIRRERGVRRPKWKEGNSAATETNDACLEWLIRTTTLTSTQATTFTQGRQSGLDMEETLGLIVSVAPQETKAKQKPKEDEHTGLNKRQILVISTCSTVIGAFFVTAFILRIRNYMKRSKQDKDGTRRHMRAASMPHHQRTHHGSLDHFANNENNRRWSHFNPFNTDR